jgi:hypothetical protein
MTHEGMLPLTSPPAMSDAPASDSRPPVPGAGFAAVIIGTAPLSPILAGLITVAAEPSAGDSSASSGTDIVRGSSKAHTR